jgi:endonuclease/exonuclease/phosphatase family metal-dependent hydrolase
MNCQINRFPILAWVVVVVAAASPLAGEEPILIRAISYNVQFLPPPAAIANKRKQPEYRAARIATEVSKFDIVGLQEVFHLNHRAQIIQGVTDAWKRNPGLMVAPRPDGFTTNGGTLLLTKSPIEATNSTVFKHFSKPDDYGIRADGFAAKGVIHGRVAIDPTDPTKTIDVYVTHLEARADHLRPKQYDELAAFIQQTSDPHRPMILVGDMNTKGMTEFRNNPESQYVMLMRALNGARPNGGVIDVWTHLKGDQLGGTSEQESSEIGKRIDYIFVGNPESPAPNLVPQSIVVETYQDEQVTALSDHNAVVAEFAWKE